MNIYLDKLAHVQVIWCTLEDTVAHYLGALFIDDVMRHNTLITIV